MTQRVHALHRPRDDADPDALLTLRTACHRVADELLLGDGEAVTCKACIAALAKAVERAIGVCPDCGGTGWDGGGYPVDPHEADPCSTCEGSGRPGQPLRPRP